MDGMPTFILHMNQIAYFLDKMTITQVSDFIKMSMRMQLFLKKVVAACVFIPLFLFGVSYEVYTMLSCCGICAGLLNK